MSLSKFRVRSPILHRNHRQGAGHMGETIQLTAEDGVTISAYRARPKGDPKGGVVVVQEIFGVNDHIRSVADGFAADGYEAIAPAIFDRVETGVEVGYDEPGFAKGREVRAKAGGEDRKSTRLNSRH